MTDAGVEQLHKVEAISGDHERRISQGLTAGERRQLVALLVKLPGYPAIEIASSFGHSFGGDAKPAKNLGMMFVEPGRCFRHRGHAPRIHAETDIRNGDRRLPAR